jgi:uncharacterized membrane protein (DUF2068 family)
MLHLRIIGIVWMAFGSLGAFWSVIDFVRNFAANAFKGPIQSDIIAFAFCVAAAIAGYGVWRHRRWARLVCAFVSVIFLLYAASFLLMVGLEFGVFWYVLLILAALFSIYSIVATIRFAREQPPALLLEV